MAPAPAEQRRSGDPRALLAGLYDAHAAGLYRYALVVLADPEAAEDVMQQVFAGMAGLGERLLALEQPEHYLRRAVRNECFSALRRLRLQRESQEIMSRGPMLVSVTRDAMVDDEERVALEAALRTLPMEQREVVVLKVYQGHTFAQIAELTEEPLNTIASRYRYALEKLRVALLPQEKRRE